MKFVDEFRDPVAAKRCVEAIEKIVTRSWTIMEVCGGQTHAIVRFGIQDLLPANVELVHGPGCPVCVTPLEKVDQAISIASSDEVIFCSFGDMLRVPGTEKDLLSVRAQGGDIRVVYSPLDAVKIAGENPDKQVVFFAVGFETTAPANALAVHTAKAQGLRNFSVLVSHVLVPPAIEAIMSAPDCRVQGFLAAGHVCTITGVGAYEPLARKHRVPIVVTGFEPLDILLGLHSCLVQLESGIAEVENQYERAVRAGGNTHAQAMIDDVFQVIPRNWRGIGEIGESGWALREAYADYDAEQRFDLPITSAQEPQDCISGLVLQGVKKPRECPQFGTSCTPDHPLGATMVSGEGACAAYFRYRRGVAA